MVLAAPVSKVPAVHNILDMALAPVLWVLFHLITLTAVLSRPCPWVLVVLLLAHPAPAPTLACTAAQLGP